MKPCESNFPITFGEIASSTGHNLLDVPLHDFKTAHPHMKGSMYSAPEVRPRDVHFICLTIVNVEGVPDDVRQELKKKLSKIVFNWYFTPKEAWMSIWEQVYDVLKYLPAPIPPAPTWCTAINDIITNTNLGKEIIA